MVVLKAIEKDVALRYQNAHEFLDALDQVQSSLFLDRPEEESSVKNNSFAEKRIDLQGSMNGFSAIAGMNELKETLFHDIVHPLADKELYEKYQVSPPNGMLLYGPPGCGKTFFAKKLAEEVEYNYIELKPSDLASTYVHGTQEKIGQLFKKAKEKAPTIIFIDEIDAFLPSRGDSNLNHHIASEVNEFLAQMTDCHEYSIFIIAATNRPEKIDPAIMRTGRLDKLIYVDIPDYESRYAMFEMYCRNRPLDPNIDFERLSGMTENFVSSDIKYIINEASRNALKGKVNINQIHFEKVIENTQPSISQKQIESYTQFRNERNFK
jgi:transitional endoplasmic reticulum ATPase